MISEYLKKVIKIGFIILVVWVLYITFIYIDALPDTMTVEKDCDTWNPNAAQTKTICLPKVYTTFGWMG
jgi:hypothetical protein